MMEANRRSTGGRPRDTFVDPHLLPAEDEEGNVIPRTCRYCGHQFSRHSSVPRIKAHLGGVSGHGVAPCEQVPSDVKEAARNVTPSTSTSSRPGRLVQAGPSTPNIPHTQQPRSHQNDPAPCRPQFAEEDIENMIRSLLSSPQDGQYHSGHDITHHGLSQFANYVDISEEPEGLEQSSNFLNPTSIEAQQTHQHQNSETFSLGLQQPHYMLTELLQEVPERPLYTPWLNEKFSPHGVLASQHPTQQHLGEVPNRLPCEDVRHNAAIMDTSISQDFFQEHPMQRHQGEVPNGLPYENAQQDAAMMDSTLDASIHQDFLRGRDYPNSWPPPAHREDVSIAKFNNHEGLESQHHIQENLQGDQRVNSLDLDPYPSVEPQLHHMHIDPVLESLNTPACTYDQAKHDKKRKLLDRSPPTGKKIPLATKIRGETSFKKVGEICASLEDNSISRIGVYGMGGCGKTTIMKHIHNQLLEEYFIPFSHVIWVTVSQDRTISKLQHHLADEFELKLSRGEDKVACSISLHERMQKMCYALILDDVWNEVDLEEVGIPEPSRDNGCKLIVTTRSLDVCKRMQCKPIFLDVLPEKEAWDLFVETLGVAPENSIIEGIKKDVVKECAGLPLAIVTIARSMTGILDVHEWRNALDSLKNHTYGFADPEKKFIGSLKFSYDRLSEQLQQCLLYCALYPEDYRIKREELIEMLISEGIVGSTGSRSLANSCGHTIMNRLENACLLIRYDSDCVGMHDLIRDMCLVIAGGQFLEKCGSEHPPNESEYTKDVEKVSLVRSYFKEIPSHMAPHCPKLSTLLLSKNYLLTRVADSFFMQLPRLMVLNLSETPIEELPNSVTNLVSLNALVLRHCVKLKCLPCLASLKALKKLDLYECGIEEAPEGLGELVNLTYLDLFGTNLRTLPSSTLGNLVKLQYLKTGKARITIDDVKELKYLETFQVKFVNLEAYNGYVRSMLDSGRGLSEFDSSVSCGFMLFGISTSETDGRVRGKLSFTGGDNCLSDEVIEIIIPSPEIVDTLEVNQRGGIHFVISEVEREVSSSLHKSSTRLHIKQQTEESGELKCLFYAKLLLAFPTFRKLDVCGCNLIEELISTSPSVGVFSSSLTKLIIQGCDKLVRLTDLKVLSYFKNLEEIEIVSCESLESIASTANPIEKEEESNNPISFPKLRHLELTCLPNLRSICDSDDTLICPSIESILVVSCRKLKSLESIASTANPIENEEESNNPISFPKLRVLCLWFMPNLRSIGDCDDTLICPSIEWIDVLVCPKLKRLPLQVPELDNNGRLRIVGESEWWESLEWDHPDAKTLLQPYFEPRP